MSKKSDRLDESFSYREYRKLATGKPDVKIRADITVSSTGNLITKEGTVRGKSSIPSSGRRIVANSASTKSTKK
jgi:hypothetical protein